MSTRTTSCFPSVLAVTAALALVFGQSASAEADDPFAVGVVASDDPALKTPTPRHESLDPEAILGMVRRAVDLIGGMGSVVPDTARTVLLKVNISTAEPTGSGVVTDARLARAVALLVHEVAPRARILIAEGAGGWMSPALKDCTDVEMRDPEGIVDGFEVAGHRATVAELRERGIDIECYDLNFDRAYTMTVPGGGLARDEYDIAAAVIDADVWINLPVAKTHGAKITCCMKNHFGILPGRLYGWNKATGTADHAPMPHAPRVIDEAWVDLWTLSRMDLNVVDMIRGTEAGAFSGSPKRSNIVLAGRDPVATDLVAARLMGFNPDDFEFADLAWQRGMGPGLIDRVDVRGGRVEELVSRYKKAGVDYAGWGEWQEHANYGMGPRRWTLLGPLPKDHRFGAGEIAALTPVPGEGEWSPVVFFGHDKIDLDKYYDDPVNAAVYAFTRFSMATSDSVRFWVGSDEGLQVWVDGESIYEFHGRRRHQLGQEKLTGYVEAGEHTLLVRAQQGRGRFDFSFNICEPIDDEFFAGNRYPGLRYYVVAPAGEVAALRVAAENVESSLFGELKPHHEVTLDAADPLEVARDAPDSVLLEDIPTPVGADLVSMLVQMAQLERADLDSTTLACVSRLPFSVGHVGFGRQQYAPDYGPHPVQVLRWLDLRFGLTYGYGRREGVKSVIGWLAGGRAPIIGHGDGWARVTGYRRTADRTELRLTTPDTTLWLEPDRDWFGAVPGGEEVSCPVLVVERGGDVVTAAAIADSLAAAALAMARRSSYVFARESWGERVMPVGLSGWDEWVTAWERRPFTPEWAREPYPRGALSGLGQMYLKRLADSRGLAADYFAAAGERLGVRAFSEAGAGYREVVRLLDELASRLPQEAQGEPTAAEAQRLDAIGEAKPLLRQARAAERRALEALRQHLGAEALPEVVEDPLSRRALGRKLFTWHTDFSQGVYELTMRGEDLQFERVGGKEHEGLRFEVLATVPQKEGWQVEIEVLTGIEFYRVLQQPTADNDWTAKLRLDEGFNRGRQTDLAVWALPSTGRPL